MSPKTLTRALVVRGSHLRAAKTPESRETLNAEERTPVLTVGAFFFSTRSLLFEPRTPDDYSVSGVAFDGEPEPREDEPPELPPRHSPMPVEMRT